MTNPATTFAAALDPAAAGGRAVPGFRGRSLRNGLPPARGGGPRAAGAAARVGG